MGADRDGIDPEAKSYRYFRNAVERHWDPGEIDLSADRERVAGLDEQAFERLRTVLALFGAGETAVTEDLAPLAVVLEDVDDQLFLTSQLYEEAKHADFFDRYWRTVVRPAERDRGVPATSPTDDRWFDEAYDELFERTEAAMERLLTEDTPETRARAYCHYHLTVEGILAQTGYYGVQRTFSGELEDRPELPGLVAGVRKIRGDEGRHVGFGMAKLADLVERGAVEPTLLYEVTSELADLVQRSVAAIPGDPDRGPDVVSYAAEKHAQRLDQIVDASRAIPDVEELVRLAD